MNNAGLDDFIKEFELFCKKRGISYKRNDRGVSVKNAEGLFNIHIYMK